ncbi:MAG TPA: hypothetical protein VJ903_01375 [Clostridia bacterium]|nr:hypothetical protein [Clostridia bacterium]
MIFELKKNLHSLGGDFALRDETLISFCNIDFIKGGIVLTNAKGQLIAQLFQSKNFVTVTIADGPSLTVNQLYDIKQAEIDDEERSFINDSIKHRQDNSIYSHFGNPSAFRYDLFVAKNTTAQPMLAAEVIPHPWKEDTFKIRIHNNVNQLKVLALCLAFTLIAK